MGDGGAMVAIIAIGCGTGMVWMFFETIKTGIANRGGKHQNALVEEVRALRQEVAQLRHQNNDLILNFDTTLARVDRRVQHLEGGAELQGLPKPQREPAALR
jgi:hypothetical protein